MEEVQKEAKSGEIPSIRYGGTRTSALTHGVDKNGEDQRRTNAGDIREWRLDDLLSFKRSPLEVTSNRPSSNLEKLPEDPTAAHAALQTDPTTHSKYASKANSSDKMEFALIILNQAIDLEVEVLMNLFIHSQLVICADGGANHLYDYNLKTGHEFIPSVVAGDFDSLTDNVRKTFETAGTLFRQDHDQNTTDFDKSIHIIKEYELQHHVDLGALALGGLGGRVDQSFSSIHQLYKCSPQRDLFLLSRKNLTCLLPVGRNRIHAPKATFGPTCGIVPTSGPTTITLQGFKWDLKDFLTELGGFVSTSNEILEQEALVISDKPILWTVEIQEVEGKLDRRSTSQPIRQHKRVDVP